MASTTAAAANHGHFRLFLGRLSPGSFIAVLVWHKLAWPGMVLTALGRGTPQFRPSENDNEEFGAFQRGAAPA
jgi:hypothetical protein